MHQLAGDIGIYNIFLGGAFLFVIEEIVIMLLLRRDSAGWHWTFPTVRGHSNLRPIISTFRVALILFGISILILPIVGFFFIEPLSKWIMALNLSGLMFISAFAGAFFIIWHHVVGKELNRWQAVNLAIFILPLIGFIIANSGSSPPTSK